jgi:hypothetical protein
MPKEYKIKIFIIRGHEISQLSMQNVIWNTYMVIRPNMEAVQNFYVLSDKPQLVGISSFI